MNKTISVNPINFNSTSKDFSLELPKKCPHCSVAYALAPIEAYYVKKTRSCDTYAVIYCIYFCPHCEQFFTVEYFTTTLIDRYPIGYILNVLPTPTYTTDFSNDIQTLSPKFVEIYHQAEKAEQNGLMEICGMGYRKALEFLIKDYSITFHPDKVEEIKSKPLATCITQYINDERLITLAQKSAWIGNDESHYIRKHEDRDVSDLKSFITALVYFIGMILITSDAASITPKN